MKKMVDGYKQAISKNRKVYQEGLLFLKYFYELSINVKSIFNLKMRSEHDSKCQKKFLDLQIEIPDVCNIEQMKYKDFLKKEHEKELEEYN